MAVDQEHVLELFDRYWFEYEIFTKNPPSSATAEPNPVVEIHEEVEEPKLSRIRTLRVRSLSDQCLISKDRLTTDDQSLSPNSVLLTPKLQTILSGKEVEEFSDPVVKEKYIEIPIKKNASERRRRKKSSSKSLSDLEFEELKGFMDLGFVFSEEDKNSSLVSIIPGLQHLGRKIGNGGDERRRRRRRREEKDSNESAVSRPYLSEAWSVMDQRKEEIALMNWRIPVPSLNKEMDMKDQLRFWAQTVASTLPLMKSQNSGFVVKTLMAPEEILEFFDSYWFEHGIFTKKQPSSPPPTNPLPQIQEDLEEPKLSHIPIIHVRSLSDWLFSSETSFSSDSPSPNSVILTPKLQKLISGEEVKQEEEIETPTNKTETDYRRRRTKGSSKSLSELEFKELKGFMDLGFVFSKEDEDSSLVSIIPGLQRLGRRAGDHKDVNDEDAVSRPYLSETWGVLDQRKVNNPLMNWRIPALHNDTEMKGHLRIWAQTVASTVR
ncbi:hypothetical protein F0562_008540 [Nyssa sinensis]|uniref:DUF1685 domain-containing protein n=1 Tax=Nyssa sinensis TaxID=561372 RepID=A0A5J5AA21_9ASTE|nr:hypothetical protein F0562_008540 [Nyssa sinensis]